MKSYLSVFNSSAINKARIKFSIDALVDSLEQSWENGLPSFISHDSHRPYAWSHGLALHFEPALVRLVGITHVPQNLTENQIIIENMNIFINKMVTKNFEAYEKELNDTLGNLLSQEAAPSPINCSAYYDKGIAKKYFKEEFQHCDKDGLIPLKLLNPIGPGVYEKNGLIGFAHQYFRRSMSYLNSLNEPFLLLLQELAKDNTLDVKVKFDPNVIGYAKSFKPTVELEYWWGPHFNNRLDKIELGVTKHSADEKLKRFHGISASEFWWHRQNNILSFECEEIRDLPCYGVGSESFGCRYVHSMLDNNGEKPNHVDGAIRFYDKEAIKERKNVDISKAGRHSDYNKLWRIDGALNVEKWKEILNHYYRDNRLIGEYFGGVDDNDKRVTPNNIVSTEEKINLKEYIPFIIEAGQGIRIAISYHKSLTDNRHQECVILPTDKLGNSFEAFEYFESDFIELYKMLNESGIKVSYDKDLKLLLYEDLIINYPLFLFNGDNSVKNANCLQHQMCNLCEVWLKANNYRTIFYNIGIQYNDRDIIYSIAGNVKDIYSWLNNGCSSFPDSVNNVQKWSNGINDFLTNNYSTQNDNPALFDYIQKNGLFACDRIQLKPEQYNVYYNKNEGSTNANLIVEDCSKLYEYLKLGKLKVVIGSILKSTICSKCKTEYRDCKCVKYIDDMQEELVDTEPIGLFWAMNSATE